MDNIAQQTINKIETLIETRIPFKEIDEFIKQRNVFQSFRSAEKRMQTFSQEFQQLKDNFGMMDLDFKRIDKLFGSVTRDHILEMMKIKEDKADLAESLTFL